MACKTLKLTRNCPRVSCTSRACVCVRACVKGRWKLGGMVREDYVNLVQLHVAGTSRRRGEGLSSMRDSWRGVARVSPAPNLDPGRTASPHEINNSSRLALCKTLWRRNDAVRPSGNARVCLRQPPVFKSHQWVKINIFAEIISSLLLSLCPCAYLFVTCPLSYAILVTCATTFGFKLVFLP